MEYKYFFNSLNDFIKEIKNKKSPKNVNSSMTIGGEGWYGTSNITEAYRLVEEGDRQTAEKVQEVYDKMKASNIVSVKESYNLSDEGLFFDVGTFLEGNPEYWLNPVNEEARNHKTVIKVYVNIRSGASMRQYEYFKRGANVFMILQALESAGHSVELIGVMVNGGDQNHRDDKLITQIILKRAGQALDFDKLAYCLANISFYRRLYFKFKELLPYEVRSVFGVTPHGSYGANSDIDPDDGIYLSSKSGSYSDYQLLSLLKLYGDFEIK